MMSPVARAKKPLVVDPDVRLFQALADPTRLAIVRELIGLPEVCACDFTSCCDVRQPTVSHHLKVLREAGVIRGERRGSSIFYRLAPGVVERLQAFVGEIAGRPQLIPAASLRRGSTSRTASQPPA